MRTGAQSRGTLTLSGSYGCWTCAPGAGSRGAGLAATRLASGAESGEATIAAPHSIRRGRPSNRRREWTLDWLSSWPDVASLQCVGLVRPSVASIALRQAAGGVRGWIQIDCRRREVGRRKSGGVSD